MGGCRSRAYAAPAAPGREMLRHSMAVWCRFGTKPASGQCRAGYRRSRVNLTMVQCLIITFISLSITYCCDTSVAWLDKAEVNCVPWLATFISLP